MIEFLRDLFSDDPLVAFNTRIVLMLGVVALCVCVLLLDAVAHWL